MGTIDLNINLDFLGKSELEYANITTRERFDLYSAYRSLDSLKLPSEGETMRIISPANGFSSAALIKAISDKSGGIAELRATTLRVGKKEADLLADCGIGYCEIVACGIMAQNGDYNYSDYVNQAFAKCGYKMRYAKNHSKVILADTACGKYVIETSSNLNENPKIEQFAITKNDAVYDWYLQTLREMGVFT